MATNHDQCMYIRDRARVIAFYRVVPMTARLDVLVRHNLAIFQLPMGYIWNVQPIKDFTMEIIFGCLVL